MSERYDLDKMNSPEKKTGRSKAARRKKTALLVAVLAIAVATISAVTIAFITTNTDTVTNTFKAGSVSTTVTETFENNIKTDVSIQNTGNTSAYIRAQVLINWASEDGRIYATAPVLDTDYTITYTSDTSWQKGSDGFWYYTKPVAAGANTSDLIEEAKMVEDATAPDGYSLSVEIIASSIQSSPTTAVTSSWTSGVSSVAGDGTLSIIG